MPRIFTFFLCFACLPLLVGCDPHDFFFEQPAAGLGGDYLEVRNDFVTKLTRQGPSPQEWEVGTLGKNVRAVKYPSLNRSLRAWVYVPDNDESRRRPALIYCHGGFSCDTNEVMAPEAFIRGGYVVMAPTWRGENGNPGHFEMMFGEVDDAVNAARWLAKQPYVDSNNIYMFGHSVGGGISALVSLMDDVPVCITGGSGGLYGNIFFNLGWNSDWAPFSYKDATEKSLRLLEGNTDSMQRPHYCYLGKSDFSEFHKVARKYVSGKVKAPMLHIETVPGDHESALPVSFERFFEVVEQNRKSTPTRRQSTPTEQSESPEQSTPTEQNESAEQNIPAEQDESAEQNMPSRPGRPPRARFPFEHNIPHRPGMRTRQGEPHVPPRQSAVPRETAEQTDASAKFNLIAPYVDPQYGFRFKRNPSWIRQYRNGPCFFVTGRTGVVEAGFMVQIHPRNPKLLSMTRREAEQDAKKFGSDAKVLDFKKTKFKDVDCIYLRLSVVSDKAGRCIFVNHGFEYKDREFYVAYFAVESKFEEYSPVFEAVLETFQLP